ncbi:hypothetical protein Bca101_011904 [Brassica carinata]
MAAVMPATESLTVDTAPLVGDSALGPSLGPSAVDVLSGVGAGGEDTVGASELSLGLEAESSSSAAGPPAAGEDVLGEAAPEDDDLGAGAEEDFCVEVGAFAGAVGVLVGGAVVGDGAFFGEAEGASAAKAVATMKANRANTINWRAIFFCFY